MRRFAADQFHELHSAHADMLLIETVLNPSAKLPRSIVLPAGDRAELHAQHDAARPERFDSEHARPVYQHRRPRGIVPKFSGYAFECRQRRIGRAVRRDGDVHKELAPVPAEIRNLGDLAIGDANHSPLDIAYHRAAQREMFDAPDDGADPHCFAHHILIFDDREKAVNQIANKVLRAETDGKAREPRSGGNWRDVKSELG
jgi:hypothetical protein